MARTWELWIRNLQIFNSVKQTNEDIDTGLPQWALKPNHKNLNLESDFSGII